MTLTLRDLRDLFVRVSGQAAADLGYVNPGTDARIGGELGTRLGAAQSAMSFKGEGPPVRLFFQRFEDGTLAELRVAPTGHPYLALAVPRGDRWATFRVGWHWDANWGDANVIGYNPDPSVVGGYIADVRIKLNADRPFIDVEDAA